MDRRVLDELERRLREERDSLHAQLREYGADDDHPDEQLVEFESGFADSGQATEERARVLSLIQGVRQGLAEVERAIAKVESGTGYGVCERCGEPIAPERLEALPWARLCIRCKQLVG